MISILIEKAISFAEELKIDAMKNAELTASECLSVKIYFDRIIIKLHDEKIKEVLKNANIK